MTITIGSWAIPTIISVLLFLGFFVWEANQPTASGYGAIGAALVSTIVLLMTAIAGLVVWLIWAIIV